MKESSKVKMSIGSFLFIIAIVIVLVLVAFICVNNTDKDEDGERTENKTNVVNKEEPEPEEPAKKVIDAEAKYIEIEVDNTAEENSDGISYTDPLKITDKDTIDELIEMINDSEYGIDEAEEIYDFESCPMVTFYFEDSEITIIASERFFATFTKDNTGDKTLYTANDDIGNMLEKLYFKYSSSENEDVRLFARAAGYNVAVYDDNSAKLFIKKDWELIIPEKGEIIKEYYKINGLDKKIVKLYQGNNGYSVDPLTFFIMEDGSVYYIQPTNEVLENEGTIPDSFNAKKVDDLEDVKDIKTRKNSEEIYAINSKGEEIPFWNQEYIMGDDIEEN